MKRGLVIALLFFSITTPAQQQQYKNLVLEGGGVRGFAYVGAMQVLDSLGILKNIERVGGTSAGAIQAMMLSVGYTPNEVLKAIENLPLKQFNDGSFAGGIYRLPKKFGFYKGDKLTAWIEKLINDKTGNSNITFLQLHQQKNEKHYKDLYMTGSDLSYRCLRVFSYETYPNMKIKDALRISFSIPLYFEPVMIDDSGNVSANKNDPKLHMMVDGGLLSNYPLQIFDNPQYFDCKSENKSCRNMETIGLLLEKPDQLDYRNGNKNTPLPINNLNEYIVAVYKTAIDRPNPDEPGETRTITLSDMGLGGRVRKLPQATIQQLIESGKVGVRNFFEKEITVQ
jgi:NTE family protein